MRKWRAVALTPPLPHCSLTGQRRQRCGRRWRGDTGTREAAGPHSEQPGAVFCGEWGPQCPARAGWQGGSEDEREAGRHRGKESLAACIGD